MATPDLLPTQQKVLDLTEDAIAADKRLFVLWYGTFRSGKTRGAVEAFMRHCRGKSNKYIIGGFVLRSVINNVAPYFKEIGERDGVKVNVVGGNQNPRIEVDKSVFNIYGGDKLGRENAVKGMTANGLLLDEYDSLTQNFIQMCEGRISETGALRIYTANKGNPYTWHTLHYYDRAKRGVIDAHLIEDSAKDNTHIDAEFMKEREKEFDEYAKSVYLENEFRLALPPLYEIDECSFRRGESEKPFIQMIGYEGHRIKVLPVFKRDGWYMAGEASLFFSPVDSTLIERAERTFVDRRLPRLAAELKSSGHMGIYSYDGAMLRNSTTELMQRISSERRVMLEADSNILKMHIGQHHLTEQRTTEIIMLETALARLERIEQWR